MLVIDNGDAIRGIAEVASKLDFTVNGYVGTTATQLADGQLASSEGDLYVSGADATVVASIIVVNTDTSARTLTLYLKPSSGTARAITPVSLSLGIGHSLYTDGQRITVMDASGNILTSNASILDNTAGGTDAEVTKAPTSNVFYDHTAAYTVHAADLDAHMADMRQKIKVAVYFRPFPILEAGNVAIIADKIYAIPFFVARAITIDRLAIYVTVGDAGKIARLGIYEEGVDLYPGALVQDYGTVDVTSVAVVAASADQSLTKGLYWLVLVSDGTPTLNFSYASWSPLGMLAVNFGALYAQIWWKSTVGAGALADPFVTGATVDYHGSPQILPRLKSLD